MNVRISQIFKSINGEICASHQGSLTVFIRTFDCDCRCRYCDSKFSYEGHSLEMSVDEILDEVNRHDVPNVTITGGEPLLQAKEVLEMATELFNFDKKISIETNGSIAIPDNRYVSWIADYKLPSSGMEYMMHIPNYKNLSHRDFIKFVISDKADFDRALEIIPQIRKITYYSPGTAFSPVGGMLKPELLAQWMIQNTYLGKIGAIYSLQIHKLLNVL